MSRGKSAIELKLEMAAKRERKMLTRPLRDDGMVRRLDSDPLTVEQERERSRGRKVYLSAYQRWQRELFIRKGKPAEWVAQREHFMPMAWFSPTGGHFKGVYQEQDKG